MRIAVVALALSVALSGAPAALGATASVSSETEEEGTAVSFALTAAPGEANRVLVTTRPAAGRMRTVVFRDAGAPLSAGDGCAPGAAGTVVCRADYGDFADSVDVSTGDGDDTVDTAAVGLRGFTIFIDGGTGADTLTGSRTRPNALFGDFVNAERGDDRLTGGSAGDFLQGGRGADLIDGRGGRDEATYRDERRRVRLDLAAGFALSSAGERDELRSIEDVEGGDGADVLRGSAARNFLQGGAGDDRLGGRGGADELEGEHGADRLFGGSGADIMNAGPGRDLYDGGPGSDELRTADHRTELLHCGPGLDRALADRADRRSSCELVKFG